MTNWKTTVSGMLAVIATALHSSGMTIGHLGNTDFTAAIATVAGLVFSWYAKDKNVTGGTVQQ